MILKYFTGMPKNGGTGRFVITAANTQHFLLNIAQLF